VIYAKLSALNFTSVTFVVAKLYASRSTRTFRSSQLWWVWNSWLRSFRLKRSEAYANFAKLSTIMRNFISTYWLATSAMLSRRVLRFELFVGYTNSAKLSTLLLSDLALHYRENEITLPLPTCQACTFDECEEGDAPASKAPSFRLTISRTQNWSAPRIRAFPAPREKYDTQMTQILLEEYSVYWCDGWSILLQSAVAP